MLLDKFPPMTGATSPNRIGVVDGGKDQHGRAARGGVGGDGALPVGQSNGEGTYPRRAVRDDGLASQACGTPSGNTRRLGRATFDADVAERWTDALKAALAGS